MRLEPSSTLIDTCRVNLNWYDTEAREAIGEPCGTRTHDPLIKSPTPDPRTATHDDTAARDSEG